jgi:sodium transport system permease protein
MNLFARGVKVVFGKELIDGIRDRRAITSAMFGVFIGPLMIVAMFNLIIDQQRDSDQIEVPVAGAERAAPLIDWMKQQYGVKIVDAPADPQQAVRDGKVHLVLVIREDFAKRFSEARSAEVEMIVDSSRRQATPTVRRVRRMLDVYERQISSLRLIARGVSPEIANTLSVEEIEVSSEQKRAALIIGFLPVFIILAAFAGGMQIATDTTAGERERGSLESLLVNPAPRESIVVGKWLVAVVFSAVALALTVVMCVLAMQKIPLEELGVRIVVGQKEILGMLLAGLPMCLFAPGLQMLIATFARSFKEAQSYLNLLNLAPMVPAVLMVVSSVDDKLWMGPIPLLGQYVLVSQILGGQWPGALMLIASAATALLLGLLCVWFTTRLFHRDKIIFGR